MHASEELVHAEARVEEEQSPRYHLFMLFFVVMALHRGTGPGTALEPEIPFDLLLLLRSPLVGHPAASGTPHGTLWAQAVILRGVGLMG